MLQDQFRREQKSGILGEGDDFERLERRSAQVEEIVVNSHGPVLEHLRPDLGEFRFNRARRPITAAAVV